MCAAVQDTFQETRTIPEPAGALALAGLKKYTKSKGLKSKNLIAINSGANLNFDRLGHIVERVQLGENKEVLLSVNYMLNTWLEEGPLKPFLVKVSFYLE